MATEILLEIQKGRGRIAYQETGIIQEFDGHFRHTVSKIKVTLVKNKNKKKKANNKNGNWHQEFTE